MKAHKLLLNIIIFYVVELYTDSNLVNDRGLRSVSQ